MPSGRRCRRRAPRGRDLPTWGDPLRRIAVAFTVPAERAFDYLADPCNRPAWQSSLRAVTDLDGTTWTDVTLVPGLRPRMRTTLSERPRRWAEQGAFGPFRAHLELRFFPTGDGCRVVADFAVRGLAIGPVLSRAGRPAVAADLRRAARQLVR